MQEEENVPPQEAPKAEDVPTQPEQQPVEQPTQAPEPADPIPAEPAAPKGERGPNQQVLFVTDKGFGIRTTLDQFRKAHRGTKGTRAMFLNEKNGNLVAGKPVNDGDVVTILTKKGMAGLFSIEDIKVKGRGISGVNVMTLADDDCVVAVV